MCGILGIINLDKSDVNLDLLKSLNDTLRHRGPDGEGSYINGNVGLGHKRLSIIDIGSGKQPMCNEDGTVWITYNGEIYNFKELKKILEEKNHIFKTNCDTEVIIHGYEEWGEKVLEKLRGMFAFGIVDLKEKTLLLARDRVGIKPVVYYLDKRKLIFSSEIKAIIKDNSVERSMNYRGLNNYFEYGYVPAPNTIFNNIKKLSPGHYIKMRYDKIQTIEEKRYWEVQYKPSNSMAEDEITHNILSLLLEAIDIRLISDVPLGAFLSGGVDSSAIVRLMRELEVNGINTFTIDFKEEKFSEAKYANIVADLVKSNHYEYTVEPDIRDLLPRIVYHFDEPFADSSAIPTYYVAEMARKQVTVSLSGEGGDELFAGYARYASWMRMGKFDFVPGTIRSLLSNNISRFLQDGSSSGLLARGVGLPKDERFIELIKHMNGHVPRSEIFNDELYNKEIKKYEPQEFLRNLINKEINDPLTRCLDLDLRTYLPYDVLTKTDITSMMNSLEVRVPMLDHKLIEFMATVPSGYKVRNGKLKYLLKKAMSPMLPEKILDRRKMGFGVPIRKWLAGPLRDITHGYLLDKKRASGLLDHKKVEGMVLDNEKNLFRSSTGGKIWWLLFFEMWYQDVFSK